MGFSKKNQGDGGTESESKKWVIAGISIRSSLKPIKTKPKSKPMNCGCGGGGGGGGEDEEYLSTTPTSREAKIPETLSCPPAPRKRRPASRCHLRGARDFFTPPDLEAVFKCHV